MLATLAPAVAQAGVAWHADVAAAQAAAAASRRPVCVVFVADRGSGDALAQTALADAAAEALLGACFEPVCADVRSEPDLARRLVVSQVPMVYILVDDNRLVTAFPLPASAAEFVTVAARVAQEASSLETVAGPTPSDLRIRVSPPPTGEGTASISVVNGSQVTDKFQRLSDFANESERAAAVWPAERPASALATDSAAASARPALEPAATTPWLASQAQPSVPAAPGQAVPPAAGAAPVAVPPVAGPATEKPAASPQSSFVQTLQKPFTFWRSESPAPATPAPTTPASPPPTMPPARPMPWGSMPGGSAAGEQAAASPQPAAMDPYGSMPLGLEGYCPVTLMDKSAWAEGRPQWGVRHRGRTYLFAGQPEQQAFLANPDRYAPALSGDDPVLAFESGTSMPGQRRYGVTYQSRMYLFSSPETRAAFAADPARYSGRVALAEQPASGVPPGGDATRTF